MLRAEIDGGRLGRSTQRSAERVRVDGLRRHLYRALHVRWCSRFCGAFVRSTGAGSASRSPFATAARDKHQFVLVAFLLASQQCFRLRSVRLLFLDVLAAVLVFPLFVLDRRAQLKDILDANAKLLGPYLRRAVVGHEDAAFGRVLGVRAAVQSPEQGAQQRAQHWRGRRNNRARRGALVCGNGQCLVCSAAGLGLRAFRAGARAAGGRARAGRPGGGDRRRLGVLLEIQFAQKHLRQIIRRRLLALVCGQLFRGRAVGGWFVNYLGLLLKFRQEEFLRILPLLILFHRTLQNDSVGGNMIFTRSDAVKEANGLAGIDGNLQSGPLQCVEPLEGWQSQR